MRNSNKNEHNFMIYDQRLIGKKPSDEFVEQSRARLNAMFKQRFEQREELRKEQQLLNDVSFNAIRRLAKDDPALAETVKNARKLSSAHARQHLHPPKRTTVQGRARLGSVSVTFVPPFNWGWQWNAQSGQDASGTTAVDANAGTMNFTADTGDNGKTASTAVAVGSYFQPLADNGIMDISANPSLSYYMNTWTVFDSAHAGGFIGLYVGQYTLGGEFVQAVVNQQIGLSNVSGGNQGSSSGYPLFASTPVDSDHFYEIWVWAGGDAEADGWSAFWGSAALSYANLVVPSISIFAY
jgi:hypothetical protein